jgi:hypothetical protein
VHDAITARNDKGIWDWIFKNRRDKKIDNSPIKLKNILS